MDSIILYPSGSADEDVISRLPDDVLLRILRFLPSTEDAIRTRALSRRWRHVWLCLPDLVFSDIGKTCGSTPGLIELVDAALAHCHQTLKMTLKLRCHKARANAWLQQAAERVHGKIKLQVDDPSATVDYRFLGPDKVVLDLPSGGRARTAAMSIRSSIDEYTIATLRLPAAPAVNSSLRVLKLKDIRLEGGSLSGFLSSCSHLRRLAIHFVWVVMDGQDLKISSKLLQELDLDHIDGGIRRVEVSCPKLRIRKLFVASPNCKMVGRFCAPCLEEIHWPTSALLRKSRIEFLGSVDTVRRLTVGLHTHVQTNDESYLGAWLLRSCTRIHRLDVSLWNRTKDGAYNVVNLMEGLPKLNTVTHLTVTIQTWRHRFGASIAELLSRCGHLQRLDVYGDNQSISDVCPTDCPCKRPLNWRMRKLNLDSLKHVDIYYEKYMVDWIDDLNILLRLSSKANVKMHDSKT